MMDQEESLMKIATIVDTQNVSFDDKKLDYLLINPTDKQLEELIDRGIFNNCMKFDRISKK